MYLQKWDAGVRVAAQAAFVLVAGGLGERLGFSGIKLALPVESASRKCFLQVMTLLHCLVHVGCLAQDAFQVAV